jgi:hypothetical protein
VIVFYVVIHGVGVEVQVPLQSDGNRFTRPMGSAAHHDLIKEFFLGWLSTFMLGANYPKGKVGV